VFLLAHWAIERLSREVATTSRVLAQFCAQASFPHAQRRDRGVVGEADRQHRLPIVLTDSVGVPRAWKGIPVDPSMVSEGSLDSLAAGLPIAPVIAARVDRIRHAALTFDHKNRPIPLIQRKPVPVDWPAPTTAARWLQPDTLGAVHYGEPHVLELLRWTPIVSLGGTVLLFALGLWGLAVIRQAEKRTIWVGMAKETAHQLGTPLSSLMGWSEMLRSHLPAEPDGEVRLSAAELAETVSEIERDLERLRSVASRFSSVGSEPNLHAGDPSDIVREVANYMGRRFPRGSGEVELRERYQPVPPVRHNSELLAWAIENLITNALSALDKQPSWIEVSVAPSPTAAGWRSP